jgi:hypothetical protein
LGFGSSHAHFIIIEIKKEREMVMQLQMVFQIILLLFSVDAIFVQAADLASNSIPCQRSCGNVSDISFPFGIGAGCYLDPWLEVVCNNNDSWASPKPVLKKLDLEVLNISFETYKLGSSSVIVNYPTLSICKNGSKSTENVKLAKSPFIFSQSENIFIAMGCDNFATMTSSDGSVFGCRSVCDTSKVIINNTRCNGINCCQTTIASSYFDAFNTTIDPIDTKEPIIDGCKSAFLVQAEWFKTTYPFSNTSTYTPVVLEWGIPKTSVSSLPITNYSLTRGHEHTCYNLSILASNPNSSTVSCYCTRGFKGNPYLPEGCKGKVFYVSTPFISLIRLILFYSIFSFMC